MTALATQNQPPQEIAVLNNAITLIVADPVRIGTFCEARVTSTHMRLKRQSGNLTMYVCIPLTEYIGLAAFESTSGPYGLKLAHERSDLTVILGGFDTLSALEAACVSVMRLTGQKLMAEVDGLYVPIRAPKNSARRAGLGSATRHRRSNFARRRRMGGTHLSKNVS